MITSIPLHNLHQIQNRVTLPDVQKLDTETPVPEIREKKMQTFITQEDAYTLDGAFRERVMRTPDAIAYRQYNNKTSQWEDFTWEQTALEVSNWQASMIQDGLTKGDHVAVMMSNCREWAIFDQAALGLGLITVPIYTNDRVENVAYILKDAEVKCLLLGTQEQWEYFEGYEETLEPLTRVLVLDDFNVPETPVNLSCVSDWIWKGVATLKNAHSRPDDLAAIVYTSGTTGKPKGVMLSHNNILWNADAGIRRIMIYPDDLFLSFLPLSHMLERTVGYYLPMLAGAPVAYARSIPLLGEDLQTIKPTVICAVPRIFEKIYGQIETQLAEAPALKQKLFRSAVDAGWKKFQEVQQSGKAEFQLFEPLLDKLVGAKVRAKLGGKLRFAVCGGAPLSADLAKLFIGLGIPLQQGYGLTETSPMISANGLTQNDPFSVGMPVHGIEVKLTEQNELLTRGPCVMRGYWNNDEATRDVIDEEGWLHTGDVAEIRDNHIYITGRLKEIIVLANGEKVPPIDMEMAIALDDLFDQVLVIGEGKPCLTALVTLNEDAYPKIASILSLGLDDDGRIHNEKVNNFLIGRIAEQLHAFPGYAKIKNVAICPEPWTVENGLMTPTLKLRRNRIHEAYTDLIESMY